MDDYIIKDSSIWSNPQYNDLTNNPDATIKIGQVREVVPIDEDKELSYICDVWLGGKYTAVQCFRTARFGGLYNFEEFTYRGFELDNDPGADSLMDYKQGDTVIIAYLMGDAREGIILGAINHPGRKRLFKASDDIVYQSEFNGVNKSINKDGEYKVTFKGQPINIDELTKISKAQPIPPPEYDEKVGFSYYQFDKTGSYILSDSATDGIQSIKVDKPNGKIEIVSGDTSFTIDKNEETYTIKNKITTFESSEEFNVSTKITNVNSSSEVNVNSAKINTTGELTQKGNVKIQGNTNQSGNVNINGNLTTTGKTSLAGGNFALVYDVAICKGPGNAGAPVISQLLLKKTTQTKAT